MLGRSLSGSSGRAGWGWLPARRTYYAFFFRNGHNMYIRARLQAGNRVPDLTSECGMTDDDPVVQQLAFFFQRNGYVRLQNPKRLKAEGRVYKKGDEVRLVAESRDELRIIRRLLRQAGFKPGSPFTKARQFRQPVYGRGQAKRFLVLIHATAESKRKRRGPRRTAGP